MGRKLHRTYAIDRWGYIDETGKYVIPIQFQYGRDFSEGLAAVMADSAWGYVDTAGKYAVKPEFEEAGEFREGLARVKKDGTWGYIKNPLK